jgi:hypothetical protein
MKSRTPALLEDAGPQTVSLSGISTGAPNETQTLTVTATSSNTALIPHPTVNYTSPNATGTLTFTPVANARGLAVITVTVNDGETTTDRTFLVTVNQVNKEPTFALPSSGLPAGETWTARRAATATGGPSLPRLMGRSWQPWFTAAPSTRPPTPGVTWSSGRAPTVFGRPSLLPQMEGNLRLHLTTGMSTSQQTLA